MVLAHALVSALAVALFTFDLVGSTPQRPTRFASEVPCRHKDSDCFQANL